MLLAHEFGAGYIGEITQLTLVLPIDDHDRTFLVTLASGKPTAIMIDKRDSFLSFMCEGNTT